MLYLYKLWVKKRFTHLKVIQFDSDDLWGYKPLTFKMIINDLHTRVRQKERRCFNFSQMFHSIFHQLIIW